MTTIIINRRRQGLASNERALPRNQFQLKERNLLISIREVLLDDPLTKDFASNVVVDNATPSPNEISFTFESDLSAVQESAAINAIETYRDKDSFGTLDNFNIAAQLVISDALEQVGDDFDSESISELSIPDYCALREQAQDIYNSSGWSNLSVGEKRILIADWLIPTESEIKEIFQAPSRRSEIYRLFGYNVSALAGLEMVRSLEELAENTSGDIFDKMFKRLFTPSKASLTTELFASRSNIASLDSTPADVNIPIFSNIRNIANFVEVVSDEQIRITREVVVDISYSCTVNSNANVNWQVCIQKNAVNLDGQGMKRDGRGRNTVSHIPIRVNLKEGDLLNVVLLRLSTTTVGTVIAQSGKSYVRIEEVLN